MKNSLTLILFFFIALLQIELTAQSPRYIYNPRIAIKQGSSLTNLKNPFAGGFLLPQFSPLDLNLDGTLDLLIFDRGTKRFYTFLNDAIPNVISYTYAPQYQDKLPTNCYNYCLTYDYNNDGKMDLLIEAGGWIFQYRNTSSGSLSFANPDSLWSYAGGTDSFNVYCPGPNIPSFNDIDNDGDMDILTFDFGSTVTLYKNWRVEKNMPKDQWKYKLADECWGKFYITTAVGLGFHCQGITYWPNGDDYTPPPTPYGEPEHQGSTLLTLDTDNDGDYEALVGDISYDNLFFLKNGKKDFNYPKDTMIAFDTAYPNLIKPMGVSAFPAAYHLDINNDGKRDMIIAPNDPSGASRNKNQILLYINNGTDKTPIFNYVQNNFLQETTIDFGGSSAPTFTDIDMDGDDDLFIASQGDAKVTLNSHDIIIYYKNTGTSLNPIYELQDTNFLNLSSKNYSGIKPCFGDLNGDLKVDLIFGEASGKLKYYINTSVGATISFTENTTQFSSFVDRNYTAPFLVDFNRDTLLDLFLGNYDGTISYFKNTGSKNTPVFTKMVDSVGKICLRYVDEARNFYNDGMSSPVVADLDKDGKFDLLVGGKFGLYTYNNIESKLGDSLTLTDTIVTFNKLMLATNKPSGLYIAPTIAQLDSDRVYDIMLGNNGGGVSAFSTYEYKAKFGINRPSKYFNKLTIIPNPATNLITIEGFENEIYSILVYDVTGKQIIQEENHTSRKPILDISAIQNGVYFVTIVNNNGESFNGKFVKM